MIIKVVKRDKATSDFGKLGNYILEAQNDEAAILWTCTADYIMDVKGDGEKLAWFAISNCQAETPAEAISEILLTQSENTRSKNDKTYHLVISFREGEQVSQEQMKTIEEAVCTKLGFEGHQRLSACHINTENTHLHIAVNKVHPKTFRCVEPYYPYLKLDAICKELEVKHGLEQDNRILEGKHSALHIQTEEQSFLAWIKETVAPLLKNAQQWQDLHDQLVGFGLVIKPRGAGLVISAQDGPLSVKASSVDRSLSFKALTEKLGMYQPPLATSLIPKQEQRFQPQSQPAFQSNNALYAEYKHQQEQAWQVRRDLKITQSQERQQFMQALKTWHQEQRQAIQSSPLSSKAKQQAYQHVAIERQERLKAHRLQQKEVRDQIYSQYPIQTWQTFLLKSAETGNTEALEVLRSRKRRQEHIAKALFTTHDIDAAKHIVLTQYQPYARKNGDLVYRVKDGGVVTDEKHHVRIDESTTGATFLALSIAAERFKNQPLEVKGEAHFKQQVIDLAVQYGFDLQFSDPTMETERQQKIAVNQVSQTHMVSPSHHKQPIEPKR
ncbi:MAG: TraI/MobA(P) family conjugative relaxase [Vampirovibrionales bacterium]|nr:TraI/MobA(P) family conjugative relaxase [Vampirovibrionales bacterium]